MGMEKQRQKNGESPAVDTFVGHLVEAVGLQKRRPVFKPCYGFGGVILFYLYHDSKKNKGNGEDGVLGESFESREMENKMRV